MKLATVFIATIFLLFGCSDSENPESQAKEQIKEYTKKLEDCKDNAAASQAKSIEEKKSDQEKKVQERSYLVHSDDMVLGNMDAKIVLTEYFSPTCPHCVLYHKKIFPEVKEKYIDTGKIAYVMRAFIGNKQDMDAAVLARCSGNLDSYIKFMHILLEQQDSWVFNKNYREILTNIGSLGGVSPEKYAKCLNDEGILATLIDNTKLIAKNPNFVGTPSFFINEQQFSGPYTFEELSKAIDKAIQTNAE